MWPSLVGKNLASPKRGSSCAVFAHAPVRGEPGSASALDAITRKSQQWSERPFYTPCHLGRRGLQIAGSAVGRPVEVHAFADRIVIRQDGRIVAGASSFVRPWRDGLRPQDWVLPAAMERVRRKLTGVDDGNRQMVDILNAVLTDGLPAVEAACAEAIAHGVHSADVVLNIPARQRDPGPPATILTPSALTLRHAPIADCARYDNLRRTI